MWRKWHQFHWGISPKCGVTKIYRYSLKCIKNGSEFDLQKNGKYKFSDAVLNAIESKWEFQRRTLYGYVTTKLILNDFKFFFLNLSRTRIQCLKFIAYILTIQHNAVRSVLFNKFKWIYNTNWIYQYKLKKLLFYSH